MKDKDNKKTQPNKPVDSKKNHNLPGYPIYPTDEDIYRNYQEEKELNPEDISKVKDPNDDYWEKNEKDFKDDVSGSDLDIPGSELDDDQEDIGNEDEENNYYSIGGDDHDNLDEDNSE
jgi:hypothetical protein